MHRHDKPVSLKSAAMWSIFWFTMAMAFAGFLYVHHGAEMASLFLTGYALEEVLSVDKPVCDDGDFCLVLVCRINTVTASSTGRSGGDCLPRYLLLPLATSLLRPGSLR